MIIIKCYRNNDNIKIMIHDFKGFLRARDIVNSNSGDPIGNCDCDLYNMDQSPLVETQIVVSECQGS